MTIVRRPSPFGELLSLRQAMDRLFEDSFVSPRSWTGQSQGRPLALDVYTTGDELVVEAAIPGIKPENVEVTVTGDTLTISGSLNDERKTEQGSVMLQEITRGSFSRSLTLPADLEPDKATANFENGLLTLRIPKAEQVKPRQIKINATTDGRQQLDRAASPAPSK